MTTGERIKLRRKQLGYNAEKLAEIIGVSAQTVYRYENGSIDNMGIDKLVKISAALHVGTDYILGLSISLKSPDIFFREEEPAPGKSRERLNRIWRNMRYRCNNPNSPLAKYYHDKGIRVCDEWDSSYETFRAWALENGYGDELTIDRIDADGDYCPENCRWVTRSENSREAGKQEKKKKAPAVTARYDSLSAEDKELMAKIATLPATVKERLCDQVEGAIMMREAMKKEKKEEE